MALPKTNIASFDQFAPGDFRGPYGYGRPAHMSDPNATYGFEPRLTAKSTPIPDANALSLSLSPLHQR